MLPRLLLLFTVLVWGSTFVCTKILLAYLNPFELLGLRMLIGVPILALVILFKRIRLKFEIREHLNLLAASAIITAHFLIQITGLKYTTATNTGWIISVVPLILAVMSFLFLHERIGRNIIVGIIVATVGVLLLMSKGDFTNIGWLENVGDWLILVSAFTWALYTVTVKNISMRRNPVAVTFAILLPICVGMGIYLLFAFDWSHLTHLPAGPMFALLYLGVLGTALAHWFWQEGIAKVGAAKAGIFLYLEPVVSTILGVAILSEQFGVFTAIGALSVMSWVYIAERHNSA